MLVTVPLGGSFWGAMAWWATFAPDPIVPKVLSLGAVPVFLILFALIALPRTMVAVSPEELEYERYIDSWTPPPPQVIYVNNQRDSHQEHLAEQARMFYLFGRDTPPTDWYPR
jgi:hypothetical protein